MVLYFFNNFTKYLLPIALLYNPLMAIEITDAHHAVDVAGKQRMFTQKMLKNYAMVGMKNSFGKPDEDLKKIMGEFENHLHSLENYTKNKTIKKSIKKVKKLWIPIKKILKAPPNKEYIGQLQEDLEALLSAANHTTHLFAVETGKSSGEIVDISGRQRMLSQRMASLYMLKVWGVNDKKFQEKMDASMKLFKTSLETLQKSKLNTPEITELLNEVQKSFMFFEVMNKSETTFIPTLIYKKSNDILKKMNSATKSYVDASKKQES